MNNSFEPFNFYTYEIVKVSPFYPEFLGDLLYFLFLGILTLFCYRIIKSYKQTYFKKWKDVKPIGKWWSLSNWQSTKTVNIGAFAFFCGLIAIIFLIKILVNLGAVLISK